MAGFCSVGVYPFHSMPFLMGLFVIEEQHAKIHVPGQCNILDNRIKHPKKKSKNKKKTYLKKEKIVKCLVTRTAHLLTSRM
jgi:hypothetical protein